jgi:hypothetical protein
MSTASRFDAFCDKIKLTSAQYEDAKTKYDNVCKTLHNYYYPNSTYNGSTKLLIGSYGKETAIRPPGDIDVIFKIPFETYKRFSQNETGPRGLLNEVKSVLQKTFSTTDRIRPNGMVVEVAFSTFSIEVLPAFEWTIEGFAGQFEVPETTSLLSYLTTDYGRWKTIDPRKEMLELDVTNMMYNGNTKQLVRMMKKWLDYCSVDLKAVVIERIAREFMWSFAHSKESSFYYDWMVRDFLLFLKGKRNATILMPGINENIQIGESWYPKVETAHSRAVKACEYESQKKEFDAAYEWKKIFSDDYPY